MLTAVLIDWFSLSVLMGLVLGGVISARDRQVPTG